MWFLCICTDHLISVLFHDNYNNHDIKVTNDINVMILKTSMQPNSGLKHYFTDPVTYKHILTMYLQINE